MASKTAGSKMDERQLVEIGASRITDSYLAQSVQGLKNQAWWKDHKLRISKFDTVYGGNLMGASPEENTLENLPYVTNTLNRSAHDIRRLAKEAQAYPTFYKQGEDDDAEVQAKLRAAALDTIWKEGGGERFEGNLYLDLIRGGFAAVACYYDGADADTDRTADDDYDDYPKFLRLNPSFGYPTVLNGELINYFHIETMKELQAAQLFDLMVDPKSTKDVDVVMYFDKDVMLQAVIQYPQAQGNSAPPIVTMVSRWEHGLGRVPVGFRAIDTADDNYRGLLDELVGPLRARNKTMRLMVDYLEDMVNSPYEERGIENSDALPGPTTVYHHDRDQDGNTFMRRVAPAAPAQAVFGLMNYLEAQEAKEGYQPPARVGIVSQSQASGSFVESTQGSLSSVVIEMQKYVADLRRDVGIVAMKIDEKYCDFEKPLCHAVGEKSTYTPSKAFKGWYYHKISFGAAAGMDRAQADSRVLQHLGAGLIDDEVARDQIDYIESDANLQDRVDRMVLRKAVWQKLVQDQSIPLSVLAQLEQLMGDGKTMHEALGAVLPDLYKQAQQQQAQGVGGQGGGPGPTPQPQTPEEAQQSLAAGGQVQQGPPIGLAALQPPPAEQIMVGRHY